MPVNTVPCLVARPAQTAATCSTGSGSTGSGRREEALPSWAAGGAGRAMVPSCPCAWSGACAQTGAVTTGAMGPGQLGAHSLPSRLRGQREDTEGRAALQPGAAERGWGSERCICEPGLPQGHGTSPSLLAAFSCHTVRTSRLISPFPSRSPPACLHLQDCRLALLLQVLTPPPARD